jgi:hypothetical protein
VLERVRVADTGLVVELPGVISSSPQVETTSDARVFTYGSLQTAPVVVQIIVSVLPQTVPDGQLDEFLDHERQAMQEMSAPKAQRQGDARITTVGARRFAFVTHEFQNEVTARTWATALGDREVVLRVSSMRDRPAAWAGIEDKIVASLQRP